MSIDTHILLRTSLSAEEVKIILLYDPELADLDLVDHREWNSISSDQVTLVVKPWDAEFGDVIEGGFNPATVRIKVIPGRGPNRFATEQRAIAAVLRLIPGDVCLANQDSAGPDLLRLGDVVYVDPDGFRPENLTNFGYVPDRIVIGIPKEVLVSLA